MWKEQHGEGKRWFSCIYDGEDGMMGEGMMQDMRVIRKMLVNHEQIERWVEDLPNGVKTRTNSEDPEIAGAIKSMCGRCMKG